MFPLDQTASQGRCLYEIERANSARVHVLVKVFVGGSGSCGPVCHLNTGQQCSKAFPQASLKSVGEMF